MLKEILSKESCADCRVCCIFDRDDCWEMPLITPELAAEITDKYPDIKMLPAGENKLCKIFDAEYDSDGLTRCPMLTESGCALGDRKPFDCRIWPFRIMRKGGCLLLTLSPVCETVSALPVNKISDFAAKIFDSIFEEAKRNPEMIKDYVEGYPVFAVCETVLALSVDKISDFAAKISDSIFEEAKRNPEMIKDYAEGCPCLPYNLDE